MVSSRTLRVIRTLATNVALFSGPETLAATGPFEKTPGATALVASGEIFLWTPGMRQPVPILHRFVLAIWQAPDPDGNTGPRITNSPIPCMKMHTIHYHWPHHPSSNPLPSVLQP